MKKLNGCIPGMIVHCPTKESAEALRDYLVGNGWENAECMADYYWRYQENTCYEIGEDEINYFSKEYWADGGHYICEFEDLDLENHEPDLTAEDVIEWFGKNYTDADVMKETFGEDYGFGCLAATFSAEEIVRKIVAYEAAKKAPKPVEVEWVDAVKIYKGIIDEDGELVALLRIIHRSRIYRRGRKG